MDKKLKCVVLVCLVSCGCARVLDAPRVIWGSSTRALEEARADAVAKTYRCSFNDCYDAVLNLKRGQENEKPLVTETEDFIVQTGRTGIFDVFMDDRKNQRMVVMGIPGNVDTTEVGIFFSQPTLTTVKIEVSSLSSSAKRTVAEKIFEELDLRFSVAE
ncbi:MAG TPA: hypothetical protein PKV41_04360 [Candidatus Omnitrophota bacterium]|nr:hypothetical protein [Candidatus Omnitrophota bacterium]